MLLPLNWLKQFTKVDETAVQAAERFVKLGIEAEGIHGDVIDLDVTPNRGDLLSMYGLAREYAASANQEATLPSHSKLTVSSALPDFTINADPKTYHRLTAVIVRGVTVSSSPDWLKSIVETMGANSINNIVDLTNYIMYETGIPMHAFDLDTLPTSGFTIRFSQKGEKYISLKDEERILPEDIVVVDCNGEIVDLLGVRGGKSSMIQPTTHNVLIWGVSIPRPLVRRASKLLQIHTDGSYRHERETDWSMVPVALARLADLTLQLAGGVASNAIDLYPNTQEVKQISVSVEQVNQLLGTQLDREFIDEALNRLGFAGSSGTYTVPSWRYFDIDSSEDLIEEVARLYGYNNLPKKIISKTEAVGETHYSQVEHTKDVLVESGWTEAYTESFSGTEEVKRRNWQADSLPRLANPVNRDFAFCRPELIPNLLKILAINSWSDDSKIFEVGNAFPSTEKEETHIALAAYGKKQSEFAQFVPAEKVELITPDHPLGQLFKLRRPVTVAEVTLNEFKSEKGVSALTTSQKHAYRPVSILPPSARDIAIVVDTASNPNDIINTIYDTSPESIVLVELFDQFASDKFGPNKQSLAFHVVYQSVSKTLESHEVDALHQVVIDTLKEKFNAQTR